MCSPKNSRLRPGWPGVLCFGLLLLMLAARVNAQIIYNPNDERFKQLALEKSVWIYLEQKDEYERAITLRDQGFIPPGEYVQIQKSFKVAEVELKQSILALLQDVRTIIVESVKKSVGPRHEISLAVRIRNAAKEDSDTGVDSVLSLVSSDFSFGDLLTIKNLVVSVEHDGYAICVPYDVTVDQLGPGESRLIRFTLLKDVDELTILTSFAGHSSRRGVVVQRDFAGAGIRIAVNPAAQEAQFRSTVYFDIEFSRLDTHLGDLDLVVEGLPSEIQTRFKDQSSGAYVRKLLFPEGALAHRLTLEVSMPDRPTDLVKDDTTLVLAVLARDSRSQSVYGETALELTTVGQARLDLFAANWSATGQSDAPPSLPIEIQNSGTSPLTDVRLDIRGPSEWEFLATPDSGDLNLLPGESRAVTIDVASATDLRPGIYEVQLQAKSFISNQWVTSSWKTFRVQIESRMSGLSLVIVGLALLLVIGLVVFGALRLTRR